MCGKLCRSTLTDSFPVICCCREFKKMILLGYKFAQRMDNEGAFDRFDISHADKQSLIL